MSGWNTALPAPTANALSAAGWCIKYYYSMANARYELTLHAHNGTALTNSSPIVPPTIGDANLQSLIISTNGLGTIRLYMASTPHTPISRTPLITITGGPTAAVDYAGSRFTMGAANGATPPSLGARVLAIDRPMIEMNPDY
jgi:hypothetical protein